MLRGYGDDVGRYNDAHNGIAESRSAPGELLRDLRRPTQRDPAVDRRRSRRSRMVDDGLLVQSSEVVE
jgi:hypothetical protein